MIYAKGHYDNTISPTNPHPITVQSGLNTEDEMFVFGFQFLPYQLGDENIIIENEFITDINEQNNISKNNKLEYIVDILGRYTKPILNTPLFYIYDNGAIEKRIIIKE